MYNSKRQCHKKGPPQIGNNKTRTRQNDQKLIFYIDIKMAKKRRREKKNLEERTIKIKAIKT